MKKLLAIFAILGFTFITGFSQNKPQEIRDIQAFTKKYQNNLNRFNSEMMGVLGVEARFCTENWGLDSLDNLVKQNEGQILIESIGGNRYRISQELVFGEGEDAQDVYLETYIDGDIDFLGNPKIDSTNLFFVDGSERTLFSKTTYEYDGDLLVKEDSYSDYSIFGLQGGIILSDRILYYYDNSKYLISEANYSYSFFTELVEFSDSTVYVNNSKGNPEESFYYEVDFSGVLGLSYKTEYSYNNNDLLVKEENYFDSSNWTISDRTTYEYLTKINVSLDEVTYDGGASWTPQRRDSTYYTANLPYNYFNRETSELYEDSQWKIDGILIAKDCSGTYTTELEGISFSASISNDNLYIFNEETIIDANLRLYNISGQTILNNYYNVVPESIKLNNINSGIYLIEIISPNQRGIKKVIKI